MQNKYTDEKEEEIQFNNQREIQSNSKYRDAEPCETMSETQ